MQQGATVRDVYIPQGKWRDISVDLEVGVRGSSTTATTSHVKNRKGDERAGGREGDETVTAVTEGPLLLKNYPAPLGVLPLFEAVE